LTRDFSGLFEAHAALVHRTAWRVTGRAEDAEDVLQSVFLHVLRKPPEPWPDDPAAYLHRSAVNASIDLVRGRKRRAESGSDALDAPEARPMAGPGAAEDTALGHLDGERLARRLRAALPQLSPFEAEVFSLRFFEGMSNTEVASLLGKTANHVGVTLHSARTKLRTELFPQTAEASHD
jgi:RNA polymerase sigma-70 factor (ECF subfamily)